MLSFAKFLTLFTKLYDGSNSTNMTVILLFSMRYWVHNVFSTIFVNSWSKKKKMSKKHLVDPACSILKNILRDLVLLKKDSNFLNRPQLHLLWFNQGWNLFGKRMSRPIAIQTPIYLIILKLPDEKKLIWIFNLIGKRDKLGV